MIWKILSRHYIRESKSFRQEILLDEVLRFQDERHSPQRKSINVAVNKLDFISGNLRIIILLILQKKKKLPCLKRRTRRKRRKSSKRTSWQLIIRLHNRFLLALKRAINHHQDYYHNMKLPKKLKNQLITFLKDFFLSLYI